MLKKILFHSNYHGQLTGFGKNCKNILSSLFKTGKYEIVELANGIRENDPQLALSPWKCVGMTPVDELIIKKFISQFSKDQMETAKKRIFYGDARIDEVIKTECPDFYINVEDVWASAGYVEKEWWNKFPCMIWTTLDSLPILPTALQILPKVQHYYSWADFATQDLKKRGMNGLETLHGAVKTDDFFKINEEDRIKLRLSHGIDTDYVAGFVFRNQLRKSVPNFLEGLNLFIRQNRGIKTKALFVTNFEEGWDIRREILGKNLDISDVLTVYVCSSCNNYSIKPCVSNKIDCPHCATKLSCSTVNISKGLTEKQLNEVYNIMDVYCHPFTSGGQEIPIQEAKLCELITLVTNYSCGTESCSKESGGLELEWDSYSEFGSQFIKATTRPVSIAQKLKLVHSMSDKEKRATGKIARQYVIDNYSTESVSRKLQNIIDSAPLPPSKNLILKPNQEFIPDSLLDNRSWLLSLYRNMLAENDPMADPNFQLALESMENGELRENVIFQYRQEALKRASELLPKDPYPFCKDERVALIINDSPDGDLSKCYSAIEYIMSSNKYCCVFCGKKEAQVLHGFNCSIFDKIIDLESKKFLLDNFHDSKIF